MSAADRPEAADGAPPAALRVAVIAYDLIEYTAPLAEALAQHATVCLIVARSTRLPPVSPRIELVRFDKPRYREPLKQLRTVAAILRAVRRFDPDVVHLQGGHMWFNLVLPLLRRPLVVTIHDLLPHLGDRPSEKTPQVIRDLAFRRADHLIVHAERLRQEALAYLKVDPARVHVVPHLAVGAAPAPSAQEPPADDAGPVVLFFGRIWAYKGLDYLIEATPAIAEQVPDVRVVIGGQGEDFDRYRRLMEDPSRFEVHNEFVSDELRAELFRRASVVVLPYVEATQSGVVPIAYAFAKPVVVTSTGGLPELVDDGRTGLVVPPRDVPALTAAIVRLLRDPDLARTLGQAGRRKIDEELAPDAVARATVAVYATALGAQGGRSAA